MLERTNGSSGYLRVRWILSWAMVACEIEHIFELRRPNDEAAGRERQTNPYLHTDDGTGE